jgi:hypothetical protein
VKEELAQHWTSGRYLLASSDSFGPVMLNRPTALSVKLDALIARARDSLVS